MQSIVLKRRSIRKYTGEPVTDSDVQDLLKAAMSAPSAGDERPWHFVVLTDHQLIDKIPEFHPYSGFIKEAPVVILVCGDETLEKYKDHWVLDCAAATENILIAATEMKLGACWLGIYPVQERIEGMRKLLGIPEHVIPFSLVALGHSAEEKEPCDRYMPERVHKERW